MLSLPPQPNSGQSRATDVSRFMCSPSNVFWEMAPKKQSSKTLVPTSRRGRSEGSPTPPPAPVAAADGATGAPAKRRTPEPTSHCQSPPSPRTATCAPRSRPRFCNSSSFNLTAASNVPLADAPLGRTGRGMFSALSRGNAYFNIKRAKHTVTFSLAHISCKMYTPLKKKFMLLGILSKSFSRSLSTLCRCACSVSRKYLWLPTVIVSRKWNMLAKRNFSRFAWSCSIHSGMSAPRSAREAR
mmetsp:Transcript_64616/g.163651  ORF Transcript_64616/g.163651 Transcript_64616/m.163651 type:complete len:242 (+) Transcript_64616:1637-2362(+)